MKGGSGDVWRRAVEEALRRELDTRVSIRNMERRPFRGSSSHRLEELRLELDDGSRLALFAKEVGSTAKPAPPAAVKPAHLLESERETLMYLGPLKTAGLGTARCYGTWDEPGCGRSWLLLEKAAGSELFQRGEMEVWTAVCRWLARLHARFADSDPNLARRLRLLRLDGNHLRERMAAARSMVATDARVRRTDKENFLSITRNYQRWIENSDLESTTLLHGDFYPANILVSRDGGSWRVCPVDWEMASWGPGLADLAALTSGSWSSDERNKLAAAYRDEAGRLGLTLPDPFEDALRAWRLHVAVRWVGWSKSWTPPPEQRRDWLAEALRLAGLF